MLTTTLLHYVNDCGKPSNGLKSEAERQKCYYDRKANPILLGLGDLVLAKANAYRGKRRVQDW